jgi:hypothetical protein
MAVAFSRAVDSRRCQKATARVNLMTTPLVAKNQIAGLTLLSNFKLKLKRGGNHGT